MICLYTSRFPYEMIAESFLSVELSVISNYGQKITIVPMKDSKYKRQVPPGVSIDRSLNKTGAWVKTKSLLAVFLPGQLSLWQVFRDEAYSLKFFFDAVKYLYAAKLVYEDIKQKANIEDNCIFYSYWLSYAPLAFSAYHKIHPNTHHLFISRGHGSDIYSTSVGVYYPLRNFLFQGIDRVYVVSEYGKEFLQKHYHEFSAKIKLSRLGVSSPARIPQRTVNELKRVVSCASVVSLKRIALILSSLIAFVEETNTEVEWHHFGGGELFEDLKLKCAGSNMRKLKCVLHGMVDNKEIVSFYEGQQVDCFISVSSTEGVPVSMMEAISFGIPILSTDVGGCKEIVTKQTGVLIPLNFEQKDFSAGLTEIFENEEALSFSAKRFYEEYFNAERNYSGFYQDVISL